jgi:putative transposase
MIQRGFKYRLYATAEQKSRFVRFAGVCRAVDNAALFQREHFWRRARPSYASQCRELTELRAAFDWIAAVSQTCQQQALRDLDRAFGTSSMAWRAIPGRGASATTTVFACTAAR